MHTKSSGKPAVVSSSEKHWSFSYVNNKKLIMNPILM